MAKKKRPTQKQATTKTKLEQSVEVPETAATVIAPTEAINTEAAPAGQLTVQRRITLGPAERIALALGLALLLVAAVWAFQNSRQHATATADAKQPVIPMTIDDFKDDPSVQRAIEKQLNGQSKTSTSAPTPQSQQGGSPQSAGASLQSPAGNLQAQ